MSIQGLVVCSRLGPRQLQSPPPSGSAASLKPSDPWHPTATITQHTHVSSHLPPPPPTHTNKPQNRDGRKVSSKVPTKIPTLLIAEKMGYPAGVAPGNFITVTNEAFYDKADNRYVLVFSSVYAGG